MLVNQRRFKRISAICITTVEIEMRIANDIKHQTYVPFIG